MFCFNVPQIHSSRWIAYRSDKSWTRAMAAAGLGDALLVFGKSMGGVAVIEQANAMEVSRVKTLTSGFDQVLRPAQK